MKRDRTPEIVQRYDVDLAFRRAAEALYDLLAVGLAEHDLRDAVRMAIEIQRMTPYQRTKRVRTDENPRVFIRSGADVLPMEDVPYDITAARVSIPVLWGLRHHATDGRSARVALRHWLYVLRTCGRRIAADRVP